MPADFEYRWPPRWPAILILLATSAGLLLPATLVRDLPIWTNLIVAVLSLVPLAGAIGGAVQTTITVQADGVVVVRDGLGRLTLRHRTFTIGEIVGIQLERIPIQVAPGRHPRDAFALCLALREGAQRIYQDDDRAVVEGPATRLAAALGVAYVVNPARS
jgi:hypothetical protein